MAMLLNRKKYKDRWEEKEREDSIEQDLDFEQMDMETSGDMIDAMFKEEAVRFDRENPPHINKSKQLLDQYDLPDAIHEFMERPHDKLERSGPHERVVMLIHDDSSLEDNLRKTRQEFLKQPGKQEPEIAFVNEKNEIEGKMPAHVYLTAMSVDKLIDMVNNENLSMDHPGIPESSYCLIEDAQDKGEYTFAGSLMDVDEHPREMTRANFGSRDEVNKEEVDRSGIEYAEELERQEEISDREYTADDEPLSWRERIEREDAAFYDLDGMEHMLGGEN